jgi:hypothetical protein
MMMVILSWKWIAEAYAVAVQWSNIDNTIDLSDCLLVVNLEFQNG